MNHKSIQIAARKHLFTVGDSQKAFDEDQPRKTTSDHDFDRGKASTTTALMPDVIFSTFSL